MACLSASGGPAHPHFASEIMIATLGSVSPGSDPPPTEEVDCTTVPPASEQISAARCSRSATDVAIICQIGIAALSIACDIVPQGCRQACEDGFIDTHRPCQWMPLDDSEHIRTTADDPCLGAAKQLVPAKGNDGRSGAQRARDGRLLPQTESRSIDQRSATQVFDQDRPMLRGHRRQLDRLR